MTDNFAHAQGNCIARDQLLLLNRNAQSSEFKSEYMLCPRASRSQQDSPMMEPVRLTAEAAV